MKITEIFKKQERTFSFEFFPPKTFDSAVKFGINTGQLMKLNPSFVTVTYGAGGGTQERTFDLVDLFKNDLDFTCMAHYTCVNATKEKIAYDMRVLQDMGIQNVMLLRGDKPKDEEFVFPNPDGFNYGSDLIEFVKSEYDFCVGAGAYPEKHTEAQTLEEDLENLKIKVDAGADFLVTQMFFDNNYYYEFMNKVEQMNLNVRVIPGVIPVTNFGQISRFAKMIGASVPESMAKEFAKVENDTNAMYNLGVERAIAQTKDLLNNGAPGIHFYTLNKSRASIEIYESLAEDFKEINTNYQKMFNPHLPMTDTVQ